MNKSVFLFTFISLVITLSLTYAQVDFGKGNFNLLTENYGPNQHFDGYINASFDNIDAESKFIFEIKNGETTTKEFELIQILEDNNLDFNCSPTDCSSFYTSSSPSTSKKVDFTKTDTKKTTVGFFIQSSTNEIRDVIIDNINFTISGEEIDSSYPLPSLDIGDNGEIDWRYLEPSDTFTNIENNFNVNKKIGDKIFDSDWEYCQEITLPASKKFRFSTSNILNSENITFNLRSAESSRPVQVLTSCQAGKNSNCVVNYTLVEERNFLLCAFSNSGMIPYYDEGDKKAKFYNKDSSLVSSNDFDFPIFAAYANFKELDFVYSFSEEELIDIEDAIQYYLNVECDRNLAECTVPLTIYSNSKGSVILNDLLLRQNTQPPLDTFYSVNKNPAELNMSLSLIRLNELDLLTPLPKGYPEDFDSSFNLELNIVDSNGELLEEETEKFKIVKVPEVKLKPTVGLRGIAIKFDASKTSSPDSSLTKIVKFDWEFGDNTNLLTTSSPVATHTYSSSGKYNLTLKATDDNGLIGEKTFVINIEASDSFIGIEISKMFNDFEDFISSLPANSFEKDLIIKTTVEDLDEFRTKLNQLNQTYNSILKLEGNSKDSELTLLQESISELEVPGKLIVPFNFNSDIFADVDNINPEYLAELTNEEIDSSFELRNSIALWQDQNLDIKLNSQTRSVESSSGTLDLFSIVKISTVSDVDEEYYLIVEADGEVIESDTSFSEIRKGVLGFTLLGNKEITLVLDSFDLTNIVVYGSASLSELDSSYTGVETTCGDGFCDYGESLTCPSDCGSNNKLGFIIFLLVLFLIFGIAVVFYVWKAHSKTNSEDLFKNKKDYENSLSFVRKNLLLNKSSNEIKSKLLKAGWTNEQVNYVVKEGLRERSSPKSNKKKKKFFSIKK